jgi:uroporphyrinogen-III synthase
MRVIVTRPAAQADSWVHALSHHGIDALALPLIAIQPPQDLALVDEAWRRLGTHRLVVFVSPNAAEQFFLRRPAHAGWPEGVLAASIGPGTTQALRGLGVPAAAIVEPDADASQFDSEALWQRLAGSDWKGATALIVRGDGGREWLADQLRVHGAQVEFVAAYRRAAPCFEGDALQRLDEAIAQPERHLWFFSSSEAVDHLVGMRPATPWTPSRALATHPRIAQRAHDCGFGVVRQTRPTLEAVVACIQSFAS